jgi:uncharacterized membrane protein
MEGIYIVCECPNYAGSCRYEIGCLFSSLLSWINIECAYCMAIMLICLNAFLIFVVGSLNLVSSAFIDVMCVVALAPTTITISDATFHPLPTTLLMSGWYFVIFLSQVYAVNISLQYVNSMNCMVTGVGKAILCSHGSSNIVWSENEPCWGTISYFIGEKRGAIPSH